MLDVRACMVFQKEEVAAASHLLDGNDLYNG
jgi:hypothetical protein